MHLTLRRVALTPQGTFGVLLDEHDVPLCVTAENPWLNNKAKVSCIPEGTYLTQKHTGTRFKNVWELLNVPKRSAILIHSGNRPMTDTEGCILVGRSFGLFNNKPGITDSNLTLTMLRSMLPWEFTLDIFNP